MVILAENVRSLKAGGEVIVPKVAVTPAPEGIAAGVQLFAVLQFAETLPFHVCA